MRVPAWEQSYGYCSAGLFGSHISPSSYLHSFKQSYTSTWMKTWLLILHVSPILASSNSPWITFAFFFPLLSTFGFSCVCFARTNVNLIAGGKFPFLPSPQRLLGSGVRSRTDMSVLCSNPTSPQWKQQRKTHNPQSNTILWCFQSRPHWLKHHISEKTLSSMASNTWIKLLNTISGNFKWNCSLAKGLEPGSMGIFRTFDSFPKTTGAPAKSESYELHPVIVQHKLTQQITKPIEQHGGP